jgi:hypothetical protein
MSAKPHSAIFVSWEGESPALKMRQFHTNHKIKASFLNGFSLAFHPVVTVVELLGIFTAWPRAE